MDRRSVLGIRADAAVRLVMWHGFSGVLPLYLVSEYPKSGGTWFSQMLAAYLGLPLPQNRMPRFASSVMHGHHLHSPRFRNAFCVFRDGRDVMVSAYFHMLFESDRNHPRLVHEARSGVPFDDYDDVEKNLPAFMTYMFEDHDRRRIRFTWAEFVRSWSGTSAEVVRYEELLEDAAGRLYRALENVVGGEPDLERLREIQHKFSFESQSRRKRGEEDTKSFLRKGIAGDWKEKFTPEARETFDRLAGEELILAGYERDRSWVSEPA